MKWIRERDALIAQTMAFVQSVADKTGFQPAGGTTSVAIAVDIATLETTIVSDVADVPVAPAQPAAPAQPPKFPARPAGDFRHEMQARIANFRKHQERFEREREEYCAETLTKLRAAIREGSPPPSRKSPPAG